MNKNKVSDMAKDFGLTSKDILSVLSTYEDGSKKPSQVLSADEVNLIFEHLTQKHQVKIESIYAESAPQKKPEPKAAPAPAQNQPKANNAQNQPRNNNGNNGGSRPQSQQGQQGKPAQPQQNTQPVQQQSKSTATQHPTTRVPEKKIVDTRKVTNVNLDKYDEKLQDMAERSGDRRDLERGSKEKFRNNRNRNNRQQPFSGKRKQEEAEKMRRLQLEIAKKTPLTVKIPDEISVGELASRMKKTGAEVVKCLMKNGVMASLSQMIDFDTASFVAEELGCKVEKEVVVTIEEKLIDDHEDSADELQPRAPVVVVMGHVDHGKTSLLDYIRNAHVASGEAGGITQHIGAYQVQIKGKPITFLDTPGHEAFTSMRARGAMITDIAILVVAADDGVMPQTIEAIHHAKSANVPIIVAVNKIDKPGANPDRVKQELMEQGLVPEEYGGDTIMVPVSAKKQIGIDDLLENVLLVAEVEELKANPNRAARGVIVEAKLDKGRGPVATVLVQNGTLRIGDSIVCGTTYGKVRAMINDRGENVKKAGPSVPVEILGLGDVPEAGDVLAALDEKQARSIAEARIERQRNNLIKSKKVSLDDLFHQIQEGEIKDLNIVIKADVQGSVEALSSSLLKLNKNDEVRVSIVHSGVGAVNESDVMLASASNAIIIAFNVRPDANARRVADTESVDIRTYRVIYDAINDVKDAMSGMLKPKYKEVVQGRVEIRQVMKFSKALVAGSYVLEGKICNNSKIRIIRDNIEIFDGEIDSLRRFKDEVKEVQAGYECGISIIDFRDFKEGDIIEAYTMEEVETSITEANKAAAKKREAEAKAEKEKAAE